MSKLWKALATLGVLVFLFLSLVQRVLPRIVWSVLFLAVLTHGIFLIFNARIPAPRRWGISYLALTGLTYFFAGLFGLLPSWGLIESSMWASLVSPYPSLTLLTNGIPRSPHDPKWAQIYDLPVRDDHLLFSATVVAISLHAIAAAFALAWEKRAAYWFWLALIVSFILSTVGYAVASVAGWGLKELVLPVCWTASYATAYGMARTKPQTSMSACD
jgi:hypothetical protein